MTTSIPTFDAWKKSTSGDMFTFGRGALVDIDTAIIKYNKATNDYGKNFESESCRIALDAFKTSNKDWEKSDRNKSGAITALDKSLPAQKPPPTAQNSAVIQQTGENTRKGVLFFLANVTMRGMPNKVQELATETKEFGGAVKDLMEMGKDGGKELLGAITSCDASYGAEPPATPGGFASTVIAVVKDLIGKLVAHFPGDAASDAAAWLIGQTPELVCELLGSVAAVLGTAVAIGKQLWTAASAAFDLIRTRHLENGILNGTPKIVIDSIRDQISGTMFEAIGKAVLEALMAGLAAACPAAGSVASAVKTILTFVCKVFFFFRDMLKMRKVVGAPARKLLDDKFYEREDEFNAWFRSTLATVPIISCYVLGTPMLGSMYGFLSMVSTKGGGEDSKALTMRALEENAAQLDVVKKRARGYIAEHTVKLQSEDPIVSMSLKVARGEEIKIK